MLLQRKGLKDLLREILLKDGDFDTADLSGIQKHGRFKNTLLDSIFEQLKEDVFPIERTGDKIIDLGLNYIYFAKKHHSLYMALYIDEHGDGKKMHDFSYNYFREIVKEDERYNQLSDEYVDALHTGTWVAVTGLASLMSSNIMHPTEEQIIALIKRTIDSILALDNPEIIR